MRINEHKFNVRTVGDGVPFIWGHGLMASMASEDAIGIFDWNEFPKDKKLIRYDARGHGQTDPSYSPDDYHWKKLAKDMIALADELGIEEFIAGGQSMGCATALYAGRLAPSRIKGLVLMNPPTAWEARSAQGKQYKKLARIGGLLGGKLLAWVMGRRLERFLPGWLLDEKSEEMKGLLEGVKPLTRKTLSNLLGGAALTDLPPKEELKKLDMPSLILGWTDDPSHPMQTAIELDRLLARSNLVVADSPSQLRDWPSLIRSFVDGGESGTDFPKDW